MFLSIVYSEEFARIIQTDTFGHISRWVGVSLVTVAAEGSVCVLAEAVVATDGFIDTLVNICKAQREGRHNINIYSMAWNKRPPKQARQTQCLFFKTNINTLYHFHLVTTTTREIRDITTWQTQRATETGHSEAFQTLVFVKYFSETFSPHVRAAGIWKIASE